MPVNVTGINHFGLSVADLDESIQFYTDILGLKVSENVIMTVFSKLVILQYSLSSSTPVEKSPLTKK